jgi:Flp pilus assembly pilin Flp
MKGEVDEMLDKMLGNVLAVVYDRKGVSSLEYGILAVAIVGAVATAALTLTTDLTDLFTSVATAITKAVTKAGGG